MAGAATPKCVRVLLPLLVLVLTLGGRRNAECVRTRDLHMTTYANSDTEEAVDIYIASEHSTRYRKHTLSGQQLSSSCAQSPDCAKLLFQTYPLESNSIQLISVLPLQNSAALLEYRYSDSLTYTERRMIFDENCDSTTVVGSSQQFYLVCLRPDEFTLWEININNGAIESSFLREVRTVSNVNTSTLSNFLYISSTDGDNYICYADNAIINSIKLNTITQHGFPPLSGCGRINRLELASRLVLQFSAIIWVRCDDGSTRSFDFFSFGTTVSTVAASGTYPYICPVPGVTLEVNLDNSRILFGTNEVQPTILPGTSFRSDSGICFEVQNVTLMAFIDEEKGVYVFNSSAENVTKLYDLQPCFSDQCDCLPLLLFDSRYLHVREQGGNTLIDTHENFEVVINQLVAVDLVAVFGDLERSVDLEVTPSPTGVVSSSTSPILATLSSGPNESQVVRKPTSSSDRNTDIVIFAWGAGFVVLFVVLVLFVVIAVIVIAASIYLRNRHRRGHMDVLGNAADNRPLTIGQTSMDTEQGSLPSLPPSGDGGHIYQGSGRPRPTETTFIQAAGDAPISSEIHTPHQDNSQTQTYDNLPSHSGQLDSQRIVISPQTVQPEEPPPVASRADPEGGDGIIPLGQISTDNDPQQAALVPGIMPSSMSSRTSGQHAQEQYQDRPQTPESANHTHLEPPPPDSMNRSQRSSNASSTAELLPQND